MRKFFSILFILAFSLQAISQKKSKSDPRDLKIDSLTKKNASLSHHSDSLSGELSKYQIVYNEIREKVVHYSFDPAKTSFLIDSLRTVSGSAFRSDSIYRMDIQKLNATIDSMKKEDANFRGALTNEEMEKAKNFDNLKKLKSLLDANIITEAEFTAAKKKYLEKL